MGSRRTLGPSPIICHVFAANSAVHPMHEIAQGGQVPFARPVLMNQLLATGFEAEFGYEQIPRVPFPRFLLRDPANCFSGRECCYSSNWSFNLTTRLTRTFPRPGQEFLCERTNCEGV